MPRFPHLAALSRRQHLRPGDEALPLQGRVGRLQLLVSDALRPECDHDAADDAPISFQENNAGDDATEKDADDAGTDNILDEVTINFTQKTIDNSTDDIPENISPDSLSNDTGNSAYKSTDNTNAADIKTKSDNTTGSAIDTTYNSHCSVEGSTDVSNTTIDIDTYNPTDISTESNNNNTSNNSTNNAVNNDNTNNSDSNTDKVTDKSINIS